MKKITLFLFSLFCVLSLTVNAQDDLLVMMVVLFHRRTYVMELSTTVMLGWGPDCADGSDEVLSYLL